VTQKTNIAYFYLREIPRIVKFIETENRKAAVRAGREEMGVII
jgi:hypothetical protein